MKRLPWIAVVLAAILSVTANGNGENVEIKAGAVVIVVADGAKLMVGDKVVTQVPKGTEFEISSVEGSWVGGSATLGGKTHVGWLEKSDLTSGNAQSQEDQSLKKSSPLAIEGKGHDMVFRYRVPKLQTLRAGEWPGLVLFFSRSDGPLVTGQIIDAKEIRRGVLGEYFFVDNRFYQATRISLDRSSLTGFRIANHDTENKLIRTGVVYLIPRMKIESIRTPPSSKPNFDLRELRPKPKLSVGVVAFKTESGDFVFQRFLGKIASLSIDGI